MRNKRGFTLIELLAVIVVLAIIALIATPIVMNTINNAKKGAAERSGETYIKQVEVAIATKRLEESTSDLSSLDGTYTINEDGNLEGNNLIEPLVIEVSGNRPTSGTIIVKDGEVQANSTMTIGEYSITYSDGKCSATKNDSDSDSEQVTKTYTNGEAVYYNPETNTKCTSSEAVSVAGTKTGCMKWYAFNYNGGDSVNLLLDHNTTVEVAWASSGTNASGPVEVKTQLESDTASWNSSLNARLIEASEIAKITGNTTWTAGGSNYYFHDNTETEYTGAAGTNKYAWLFDNTYDCTEWGCNVEDSSSSTYGYRTNTAYSDNGRNAWSVHRGGGLSSYGVVEYIGGFGVRPVITVLKSKLS